MARRKEEMELTELKSKMPWLTNLSDTMFLQTPFMFRVSTPGANLSLGFISRNNGISEIRDEDGEQKAICLANNDFKFLGEVGFIHCDDPKRRIPIVEETVLQLTVRMCNKIKGEIRHIVALDKYYACEREVVHTIYHYKIPRSVGFTTWLSRDYQSCMMYEVRGRRP